MQLQYLQNIQKEPQVIYENIETFSDLPFSQNNNINNQNDFFRNQNHNVRSHENPVFSSSN